MYEACHNLNLPRFLELPEDRQGIRSRRWGSLLIFQKRRQWVPRKRRRYLLIFSYSYFLVTLLSYERIGDFDSKVGVGTNTGLLHRMSSIVLV